MKEKPQFDALQKGLGYKFKDPSLLVRCLTHVSYSYDRTPGHNEVLEFLGDAVLDLAVSDLLMRQFPEKSEGDLSRMRAALVNSSVLAGKAMAINFGPLLRLGKGEERSGGRHKESILAGAFEALLGAVYLDGGSEIGPDHAKSFVTEIAVGGKVLGKGEGRSKKQSEQEAAKKALVELQKSDPTSL